MTGWMGYDFAKTSCVNRASETTLRWDSGAGTAFGQNGKRNRNNGSDIVAYRNEQGIPTENEILATMEEIRENPQNFRFVA